MFSPSEWSFDIDYYLNFKDQKMVFGSALTYILFISDKTTYSYVTLRNIHKYLPFDEVMDQLLFNMKF